MSEAMERPKIHLRDFFWLVLVVAIILWSQYARPIVPGRYTWDNDEKSGHQFLLDTATGRCWDRNTNGIWSDTDGAPP